MCGSILPNNYKTITKQLPNRYGSILPDKYGNVW